VTVGTSSDYSVYFLNGMTLAEKALLKACLGDSDFTDCNNQDTYNWDYGDANYPHMIKLVRTVTVYTDGGYYAAIWYDSTVTSLDGTGTGTFKLLNPFRTPDNFATNVYEVYTTKGTLALTSNRSEATFSFASKNIFVANSSFDSVGSMTYDGDISCEASNDDSSAKFAYIAHCLNKTDLFTLLSWDTPVYNPPYINLYTATRLARRPFEYFVSEYAALKSGFSKLGNKNVKDEVRYLTHVINTDISTNWGQALANTAVYRVYKFFPKVESTYEYVAECSNRGICARDTGVCTCFPGYTNDDCSIQNSIAL
jgi:hypothetical protein